MKSCFFLILLFLICSCGSNQSASNSKQSRNTIVINNNKDCSSQAYFYVESKYPLFDERDGEPKRSKDGHWYTIKLSKMHPLEINRKISSTFTVEVDENCKVISSKKVDSNFNY